MYKAVAGRLRRLLVYVTACFLALIAPAQAVTVKSLVSGTVVNASDCAVACRFSGSFADAGSGFNIGIISHGFQVEDEEYRREFLKIGVTTSRSLQVVSSIGSPLRASNFFAGGLPGSSTVFTPGEAGTFTLPLQSLVDGLMGETLWLNFLTAKPVGQSLTMSEVMPPNQRLFRLDPETGAMPFPDFTDTTVIPLPAGVWLILAGLGALALRRR